MSRAGHQIAQDLLTELWSALGGQPGLTGQVEFTARGSLPSPFAVSDLAAAVFGLNGAALSELLAVAGFPAPPVRVDRVMSSGWFYLPAGPSQLLSNPHAGHPATPWMTEFATADGRWLRIQASFPSLRRRACAALGVEETPEAMAGAVRKHKADELEQLLVDAGAAVAASRTVEEWLAHPAGSAVGAEPIADIEVSDAPAGAWRPTPGRPLTGIRVLDMTRVAAGPFGTRFLAACGAEVLRLDAPGSDESSSPMLGRGNDLNLGKRWAFLDARTAEGKERFRALLAQADVFVHGYRPGGIDSLLSPAERRELKPDLVEVALDAYGWQGPWRMRRGFDSLVQFSCGIANATQAWALEDPGRRVPLTALGHQVDASRPRHMPVETLDLATGYQVAAAAIRGLTRRLATGVGSVTRMSLARTAALLIDRGQVPDADPVIELPLDGPWEDRIYGSPAGPVRRLVFPVEIEGNPLFWERGLEAVGSSSPVFSF
jgi:crotonobetainyl-CoA:carnitine CoA-transferase CaiB-like acyl-CoA transferase